MKKLMLFYLLLLNLSTALVAGNCSTKSYVPKPLANLTSADPEPIVHSNTSPTQTDITTPKTFTCFEKLPRALQYIIADYAGLNSSQNNSRWSPLQHHIVNHHFCSVATLINAGARINQTTINNKQPPFHSAVNGLNFAYKAKLLCRRNDTVSSLVIINFLIKRGADLNQQNPLSQNGTALHKAALFIDSTMLHILISAQADLNVENLSGKTPLDLARTRAMNISSYKCYRKALYENCKILEEAGAQSSVELEPMPDGLSDNDY